MKTVLVIIGSLVGLGIVALFVVGLTLGKIVTHGINTYGPGYTQTTVQVQSVHLSPLSGSGSVENLVVGNPSGWASDHAFSVGKVAFAIAPTTLIGDHVLINSLVVESPNIVYETKFTTSNLQDLLKNIQKNDTEKSATTPEKKSVKKIEIKNLQLSDAKITLIAGGRTQTVSIPTITMKNMGTRSGGLTPAQLSAAVLKEITRASLQAAAKGILNSTSIDQLTTKGVDTLKKLLGGAQSSESQPAPTASP